VRALAAARPRRGPPGRTCGPTLQIDTDDLQLNFNPQLSRQIGAQAAAPWQLGDQWQAKALVAHGVELGAQGFGTVGRWNHRAPAARQSHIVGPAVFFRTTVFGGPVRFDAAWLIGVGDGSPRTVLRLRLQREFRLPDRFGTTASRLQGPAQCSRCSPSPSPAWRRRPQLVDQAENSPTGIGRPMW